MVRSGQRWQGSVKRLLDVLASAGGLVALSPILTLTAMALLITQGRPILFRQARPGVDGRPFRIVKFRTMRSTRPGELAYQTDEVRLTRLGGLLRSWSVDELPELWNVLRGEMSLVGPRPLLVEYLPTYSERQRRRHLVRPGITSWAAVNGRHRLHFDERLELDVWYVDHWSLRLDARILAMTAGQVLRRTDVSATQSVEEIGFPLEPAGRAVAESATADAQSVRDAAEGEAAVDVRRGRPRRRAAGHTGSTSPRQSR